MRKINIEQEHEILLEMAKTFHNICVENGIPYYMLGGTMLGAVRHKGFIPWDDDMDFGIPRKYIARFIKVAEQQLPKRYDLLTVDNSDYAVLGINKLSDTMTILSEFYSIKTDEKLGINIDIFPLDYTDKRVGIFSMNWYVRKLFKFQKLLFVSPKHRTFLRKIVAIICQKIFRLKKEFIPHYINKLMLNRTSKAECVANLYGAWAMKEVVPVVYFGSPKMYKFENAEFYGVQNYDAYLKQLYNNYMELPPLKDRHIHASDIYIKETT